MPVSGYSFNFILFFKLGVFITLKLLFINYWLPIFVGWILRLPHGSNTTTGGVLDAES